MGLVDEIREARRANRREARRWEYDETWYWSEIDDEPDQEGLKSAHSKWSSAPSEAYAEYHRLADQGSIIALYWIGDCYSWGHGVERDLDKAEQFYLKAANSGSWTGALRRAHFLARTARLDDCIAVLEDGVRKNLTPFYFWLAWYLHDRGADRAEYRRIDRLLARADKAGHPQALPFRVRFRASGKLGLRRIPSALKLFGELRKRGRQTERRDTEGLQTQEGSL